MQLIDKGFRGWRRKYSALALFVIAALLAGCKTLENRLVTTLRGDEAHVLSKWGRFGITNELSEDDAAELRRLMQRARLAAQ